MIGRGKHPDGPRERPDIGPARPGSRLLSAPVLALAMLVCLLLGCGVRPETRPDLAPSQGTRVQDLPSVSPGHEEFPVYFVSGQRLEAVRRYAAGAGPQSALHMLVGGPTRAEVADGLRTALAPQPLRVVTGTTEAGVAAVEVSREFTAIRGGNQLLAVAQVVWTLTAFAEIERVSFQLSDAPIEVPTDHGLTAAPVARSDYASLAPDGAA